MYKEQRVILVWSNKGQVTFLYTYFTGRTFLHIIVVVVAVASRGRIFFLDPTNP